MSAVLTKTDVRVTSENDTVQLCIAGAEIKTSYRTALTWSQACRVASKSAMAFNGEAPTDWRAHIDPLNIVDQVEPGTAYRRTGEETTGLEWRWYFLDELVGFSIGNFDIRMHYSDALQVSALLKEHGKLAKRWAGDTSKSIVAMGSLSDAEENYKRGLN